VERGIRNDQCGDQRDDHATINATINAQRAD